MNEKEVHGDRSEWLSRLGELYSWLRLEKVLGIALPVLAVASGKSVV